MDREDCTSFLLYQFSREIIQRRRLKKLDMDPNPEMPDFNRIPLPKYEPFKIFREPKIGSGEKTLNQLRVEKYLDTTKFKQLAKDNMPFMALEIHGTLRFLQT